ncbi:MAG: SRPBCC family protein [Dermatophilaceae bacterium]
MADLRETVGIAAPADRVYELLSDLPRMGEWSPECERVAWRGKVKTPVKGAHFVGHNRRGTMRWVTFGTVVAAEPGRHFAFEVYVGPLKLSLWEYFIAPHEDGRGCTVAEQWTDRRSAMERSVLERFFGNRTRVNRHGIHLTLLALKRAAESSAYA